MEVRPIRADERRAYDELADECGSLFFRRDWSALFGEDLFLIGLFDKGGGLQGGFHLYRERRLGLTFLRDPPYTPMAGPFLRVRARHPVAILEAWRDAIASMGEYLISTRAALIYVSLPREVKDGLALTWSGFKINPAYTYVLDLVRPWDELNAGMTPTRRNDISKARRDGLEARKIEDRDLIRCLVRDTFARKGKDDKPVHLDRILNGYATPTNSFAFGAFRGDSPLACTFVVHDSATAYYLLGGTGPQESHHGAGALALWEAIRHARELGLSTFDFEGSILPPIERYFRGFGGTLQPYYTVARGWWPVEVALKLTRRETF